MVGGENMSRSSLYILVTAWVLGSPLPAAPERPAQGILPVQKVGLRVEMLTAIQGTDRMRLRVRRADTRDFEPRILARTPTPGPSLGCRLPSAR